MSAITPESVNAAAFMIREMLDDIEYHASEEGDYPEILTRNGWDETGERLRDILDVLLANTPQ